MQKWQLKMNQNTAKETMNRKHRFVNPQESENHRY